MTTRFESFGKTPLGIEIAAVVDQPNRLIEFDAFSREGFPAVTALVSQLTPLLERVKRDNPAQFGPSKQFVGWYVGQQLRAADRTMVKESKAVPGKLFSVGAVWSFRSPSS